jgi:hypothetical protein
MFSKKGFVTVCLVILAALLITGCTPPIPVAVTGVTLDQATMTLTAGGATGTLVATVAPATATDKSVTWSSSVPAVATVSVNGVVTPLTAGTTTITVTTVDGDFTDTCVVTVTLTPVTITAAAIPGVTAPVTGAAPDTTVTATSQYTGTITWLPTATTFAAGTVYTATITLTAKTGYTLSGVAANFFTVAGTTTDTNPANSGVVTAKFPATAVTITTAAIPGVTAPITGAAPDTTVTATSQYTGTVTWSPTATTFAAGTVYTATITLTAKTGYTLSGVAANFFTVAGASDTNPANSGVVTAVFPATAAAPAEINIAAIPGVTAPVTGATPDTTVTATTQYTGTVTWTPAHNPFQAATAYTATITLTAKTGFTLSGVAANFFTVAGATSDTNLANSGVVTAVFPATAAATEATITIAAIPGVTPPITGATPVTEITATSQYTGTVMWFPPYFWPGTTFAGETAYTAYITITPKAGYTLIGVAANFFTVTGVTSDTNPANSGDVIADFPATEAAVIDLAAIPGVTAPITGAAPVTEITATDQYTGTVTWSPEAVTFAAGTEYTAWITLTPITGYTLTGVAANFFTVTGATATNAVNTGVVTAVFPITVAPTTITTSGIVGVTVPVAGEAPVTEITATDQYTGTVTWSPDPATFAAGTVYTATITITPEAGWTLTGVTANFFTVAGTSTPATNPADSGDVTAVFEATAATIDIVAIPGVTAPVTDAAPAAAITETDQYTGTVTWSPADDPFTVGIVYTAWITLTPKAGYTLTGVAANFFTVADATSDTNPANSGDVTAIFPATIAL